MTNDCMLLINEYIACAKYYCQALIDAYALNKPLLLAKNLKLIPKEGHIENAHYYFHGRGCLFQFDNGEIDVDFGPEGRYDGFDKHRLISFLEYRKKIYNELTEKEFNRQFDNLINEKQIIKHPLEVDDHLYYLTSKLSEEAS